MTDTAWTQEDLDALEKAIAQGAMKVKYADKEIDYRSLREMNTIRDQIRRALGKTGATGPSRIYVSTSRGLNK